MTRRWRYILSKITDDDTRREEDAKGLLKVITAGDHKMNAGQMIGEHSLSLDVLRNKACLTNQIDSLSVENQQLKLRENAALRQAELRLSTMERERDSQQLCLSKKICSIHELTAESHQMSAELVVRHTQLTQLKEEQDALAELLSCKNRELEQQNIKLKNQLQTVQAELIQTKSSLRTLEAADGHGLKVAMGMQRQITAKREQIDFLKVQIQLLEETVENLKMDKHQQILEVQRQTQELMSEREMRRSLEAEVKVSRSQEQELKARAERLEAALYRMSDGFAECQDFIQKLEQEIMRLKLQHTLDMKELQSQNLRNVSKSAPSLHQRNVNGLMELRVRDPIMELKSFIIEQRGGADEEHRPHTDHGFRRSEEHRKSRPEPSCLRNAETDQQNRKSDLSGDNLGVGRMCSGRRSPVYALLTSDLPAEGNYRLDKELPANTKLISQQVKD